MSYSVPDTFLSPLNWAIFCIAYNDAKHVSGFELCGTLTRNKAGLCPRHSRQIDPPLKTIFNYEPFSETEMLWMEYQAAKAHEKDGPRRC